jgi:hypothetical protein
MPNPIFQNFDVFFYAILTTTQQKYVARHKRRPWKSLGIKDWRVAGGIRPLRSLNAFAPSNFKPLPM